MMSENRDRVENKMEEGKDRDKDSEEGEGEGAGWEKRAVQ